MSERNVIEKREAPELARDDLGTGPSPLPAFGADITLARLHRKISRRRAARRADGNGVADGAGAAVDRASGSSGAALPGELRRKFEASLGADLSGVRVHTGEDSEVAAKAVGARAYTLGNDIHFNRDEYDPSSAAGQHLLAHEVAHTVQQAGAARGAQYKLEVSSPEDASEHEADRAADAMVSGAPAAVSGSSGIARRPATEKTSSDAREIATEPITTLMFSWSPDSSNENLTNAILPKGETEGITVGMNVQTAGGVTGQITEVYEHRCAVVLEAPLKEIEGDRRVTILPPGMAPQSTQAIDRSERARLPDPCPTTAEVRTGSRVVIMVGKKRGIVLNQKVQLAAGHVGKVVEVYEFRSLVAVNGDAAEVLRASTEAVVQPELVLGELPKAPAAAKEPDQGAHAPPVEGSDAPSPAAATAHKVQLASLRVVKSQSRDKHVLKLVVRIDGRPFPRAVDLLDADVRRGSLMPNVDVELQKLAAETGLDEAQLQPLREEITAYLLREFHMHSATDGRQGD